MKALKNLVFGLMTLVILLVFISLFLPSKIRVERSIAMKAPVSTVFEQVNTLKNWEKWSPWHQIDPEMELIYTGPHAGTGANYKWLSSHDDVGNGKLTILESIPFKRIDTAMEFEGQGNGKGFYYFDETPEGTKLTWVMEADMGLSPIGKYMGLMMDPLIGSEFEKGLENMRNIVEQPTTSL